MQLLLAPVAIPATQSYLFGTISFAITTVFPFAVILYVYLHFPVPPVAVAVNVAIPFGDTVFLFAVSFTARFGVLFSTFIMTLDDAVAPVASVTVTVSVFACSCCHSCYPVIFIWHNIFCHYNRFSICCNTVCIFIFFCTA